MSSRLVVRLSLFIELFSEAEVSRRLKPIKDLSVLILAPRKHDRQLWGDLLKNCGINNPVSMGDIQQAATMVGSGQVDVVFVDEAYEPKSIANVLIPARNVEFAGGRGVCLILCSKKATAQDVLNARKLGFASIVILPASTDTVRKHLELAARYVRPSDEELGWSAPKIKEHREAKAMPAPKDHDTQATAGESDTGFLGANGNASTSAASNDAVAGDGSVPEMAASSSEPAGDNSIEDLFEETPDDEPSTDHIDGKRSKSKKSQPEPDLPGLKAPGRSGGSADAEVVFL